MSDHSTPRSAEIEQPSPTRNWPWLSGWQGFPFCHAVLKVPSSWNSTFEKCYATHYQALCFPLNRTIFRSSLSRTLDLAKLAGDARFAEIFTAARLGRMIGSCCLFG